MSRARPTASEGHSLCSEAPHDHGGRTDGFTGTGCGMGGGGALAPVRGSWPGERPPLSRVLPIFEHLGLVLVDHRPEASADIFLFAEIEDARLDEMLPLLAEAFSAAWEGRVDRDEFAALVVEAHLRPRQVQLVRAACQYLRQAGLGASPAYVREILSAHRDFVRHWVEVFEQRFDPDGRRAGRQPAQRRYADAARTRDEFRVLDWYRRRCWTPSREPPTSGPTPGAAPSHDRAQARPRHGCRSRPIPPFGWRPSCTIRTSKGCTCDTARWPEAGCAGRIGSRTTATR